MRLLVTAKVAPVYVEPADEPRLVGSFSNGVQVRTIGPNTNEWVRA